MNALFSQYCKNLEKYLKNENTTEHSHRPALINLLESLSKNIVATNEPKRVKCGAPDIIVQKNNIPLGHIETKDIGLCLDTVENEEQISRYLKSLNNFILTDYLEFRWYVNGKIRLTASLGTYKNKKLRITPDTFQQVCDLLTAFRNADVPTIKDPKDLATRMAGIAKLIGYSTKNAIENNSDEPTPLLEQMQAFQEVLFSEMSPQEFSDMYAQTLCYGLFAARCNKKSGTFTRESAAHDLPKTNPFLKKFFEQIAGTDLDERIVWAVEHLAEVLNKSDISTIINQFEKESRHEDAIVHFYETFLAEYDPKLRKTRGVYYTHKSVVSYIVRSVDKILKQDFKIKAGLADSTKIKSVQDGEEVETHKVLILDPATGTGTFLHETVDLIQESVKDKTGAWSNYVSEHLLPRIIGFELLMAPYSVAHMKLGMQLQKTKYDFKSNERLHVYLTNTLEETRDITNSFPFSKWLKEEALAAGKIKKQAPVMVVMGNPPYSGVSANNGEWITNLVKGYDQSTNTYTGNYFSVDGQKLDDKNPKYLLDDYVKFIRFAQWRIEQTGYGVLAFVTNHGYLDNKTFRGMRQALMDTFDDMYLLDLHGNSNKKETSPDGSIDENVFDIQQGVSIGIFVKRDLAGTATKNIFHADLWGEREIKDEDGTLTGGKYHWLFNNDVNTTKWEKLEPKSPFYWFVPQKSEGLRPEYESWPRLSDFMSVKSTGVKTHRDEFVLDFNQKALKKRIEQFRDLTQSDAQIKNAYGLSDTRDWKLKDSRKSLAADRKWNQHFTQYLYRPFDVRSYFHHSDVVELPREEVTRHMLDDRSLGIITTGQTRDQWGLLITKYICDHKSCAAYDTNTLFPLYLKYEDDLPIEDEQLRPNFTNDFISYIQKKTGLKWISFGCGDLSSTIGPEDIMNYIAALSASSAYRERYLEFLKKDFPRIPFASNKVLFKKICALGAKVATLHTDFKNQSPKGAFPEEGNCEVTKVEWKIADDSKTGRIYINKTQYFDKVQPQVWEFILGGYQVCDKWLKERKGTILGSDDCDTFMSLISSIQQINEITNAIDDVLVKNGHWQIEADVVVKAETLGTNIISHPTFSPKTNFDKVLDVRLGLAAYIVAESKDDKNFGRVKFAKLFYLADQLQQNDLKTDYYREAAGPLDPRLLYNEKYGLEGLGKKFGLFSVKQKKLSNGKEMFNYAPGPNLSVTAQRGKELIGTKIDKIKNMIHLCTKLDTEQSEIIATLFACWNDLLILKKKPLDASIIKEFRERWHKKKARFPVERLEKALIWMKKVKLVPEGKGKLTKSKEHSKVLDPDF